MDKLDVELMLALRNEGTENANKFAHRYGVSERTIKRRIRNLIRTNAVRMIAVPNIVKLGYRGWARIGIKVHPTYLNNLARTLVSHPSVHFVTYTLGFFDVIISTSFYDVNELANFVNWELTKIRGVTSVETMLLVSPRRYMLFNWSKPLLRKEKKELSKSNRNTVGSTYELDEIEKAILDKLMEDGPDRPKNLALKLDWTESKIRNRLKSMARNELFRIEAVPIEDILEYEVQATIGITTGQQHPDRIMNALLKHPGVYMVSGSLGRFNIVIATHFSTPKSLNDFVTQVLTSVHGINSYETNLHIKRLKYYSVVWPIP